MGNGAFNGARSPDRRRPGFRADTQRRRRFVREYLSAYGMDNGDGTWTARCRVCGAQCRLALRDWWADHITPVSQGGSEEGELRLSCKQCQLTQGSRLGNARNPLAQSRKREEERHPGRIGS